MTIKEDFDKEFPKDGRLFYHSDVVEAVQWVTDKCADAVLEYPGNISLAIAKHVRQIAKEISNP